MRSPFSSNSLLAAMGLVTVPAVFGYMTPADLAKFCDVSPPNRVNLSH